MSSQVTHNQFLLPINFKSYIITKKSNINVYVFVLIFILFNECKYICISYISYNKNIIINLYKLHFPSSLFFLQPNKRVFHPPTFLPLQPNTHERKPNLFYPAIFPSSNFFTPAIKWILSIFQLSIFKGIFQQNITRLN